MYKFHTITDCLQPFKNVPVSSTIVTFNQHNSEAIASTFYMSSPHTHVGGVMFHCVLREDVTMII